MLIFLALILGLSVACVGCLHFAYLLFIRAIEYFDRKTQSGHESPSALILTNERSASLETVVDREEESWPEIIDSW
jgi:hypothetical protein